MYEDLFAEIGLTKSEVKVYFALLELGSSTTGPVIKKAGIASGKAYLIMEKLVGKGLVTHITKGKFKHYQAADPKRLINSIKETLANKEQELNNISSNLISKYKEQKYKSSAEILEGSAALKNYYNWALDELKAGETICVFGAPRRSTEMFGSFFDDWNKRRAEKKVNMKIVFNSDSRDIGSKRSKTKFTEVKYLKKEIKYPVLITIFQNYVASINVFSGPLIFLLKDKESADSYKEYFEQLWKNAVK